MILMKNGEKEIRQVSKIRNWAVTLNANRKKICNIMCTKTLK